MKFDSTYGLEVEMERRVPGSGGEWGAPLTADQERPGFGAAAVAMPVQPISLAQPVPISGSRPAPRKIPQLADFARLRQVITKYGLDAVVCAQPINVHYLSGLD